MLSQVPADPASPYRRFFVGGVAIGLATVPVAVGFAASAEASSVSPPAAAHGPSADALRGVGQAADDSDFPEKVEVDLHPTGYYPPDSGSGMTAVAGANVDNANFTATETDDDSASASPKVAPAGDTDTPNCTMDPTNPHQDQSPGAEGCYIPDFEDGSTYDIHEAVTPVGFDTAEDQTLSIPANEVAIIEDEEVARPAATRAHAQIPPLQPLYTTLTFSNAGQWRAVILTKTGTGGAVLPGATYRLCADNPSNNPSTLAVGGCQRGQGDLGLQTTGANGQAEWPYALPGTYTLIETAAPAGYSLNPAQPLTVPVDPKGNANRSATDADPVYVAAADTLVPVVAPSPTVTPSPTASPTPTPVVTATPAVTQTKAAVITKKKAKVKVKAVRHTRHVVHPKQPTGQLAFTGIHDEGPLLVLGLGLIAAGTGAVALGRRRSS